MSALGDSSKDPNFDIEQVKAALLEYQEYKNVSRYETVLTPIDGTDNIRHPFTLSNVHIALAAGLTGAGQLIAIHESPDGGGFYLDHPDLAGKTIRCIGGADGCDEDDHGTAVAVIAAGNLNGSGLMGVAPEADLLLFDGDVSVTEAIYSALQNGAIVLNNSWGYFNGLCTDDRDYNCFYSNVGDGRSSLPYYEDLAADYDEFQKQGVVVFAIPNTEDVGVTVQKYALPADLPYFYPELQDAWISAMNAKFYVDDNNEIVKVERLSAPCNLSAPWCLVGSGYLVVANEGGGYKNWNGSSFVARKFPAELRCWRKRFRRSARPI